MSEATAKAFITDATGSTSAQDVRDAIGTIYTDLSGGGGDLVAIDTQVAASSATFDFTAIASSYENLKVVLWGRTSRVSNSDLIGVRFNNDSGTNYDYQLLSANDTTVSGARSTGQTLIACGNIPAASATASRPGYLEILIPGYARTTFQKIADGQSIFYDSVGPWMRKAGGAWLSTAAITRVTLVTQAGDNFVDGTVATLYGMNGA